MRTKTTKPKSEKPDPQPVKVKDFLKVLKRLANTPAPLKTEKK